MPKRKPHDDQPERGAAGRAKKGVARRSGKCDGQAAMIRVLCADPCARTRADVQEALSALGVACDVATDIAETRAAIENAAYDIVIIDEQQPDGCGLDLVRELAGRDGAPRCIVTSEGGGFEQVVSAMRSGAIDFVARPFRPAEIAGRIIAAIEVVRRLRDSERRVQRLKRICKRLNSAREEVTRQVDDLCNDLVHAYQELADRMTSATLGSEFAALVRQELDVESLLRATLEFLLARTGPTNAAVFLPTGNHDFNLGAYVNYDVPRDTADVLLDHLADLIAPRFEREPEIVTLATAEELSDTLGEGASWLSDYSVTIFSCTYGGDCLAVVALFRDRRNPFPADMIQQLGVMRDIFAEQLARVVRIHHRHKPDLQWPGFDVEDDRGLAA